MSAERPRRHRFALVIALFFVALALPACSFSFRKSTQGSPAATTGTTTSGVASTAAGGTNAALAGGPPGSVGAGEVVYRQTGICVACHGANLDGNNGAYPPLVGRASIQDFPTTQLLFDYIKRSMPYTKPGSLSEQQVYDVIAFLLAKNGLVPDTFVANSQTLSTVKLPGSDPIAPALGGAPATPQPITPGSSQAAPTIGR